MKLIFSDAESASNSASVLVAPLPAKCAFGIGTGGGSWMALARRGDAASSMIFPPAFTKAIFSLGESVSKSATAICPPCSQKCARSSARIFRNAAALVFKMSASAAADATTGATGIAAATAASIRVKSAVVMSASFGPRSSALKNSVSQPATARYFVSVFGLVEPAASFSQLFGKEAFPGATHFWVNRAPNDTIFVLVRPTVCDSSYFSTGQFAPISGANDTTVFLLVLLGSNSSLMLPAVLSRMKFQSRVASKTYVTKRSLDEVVRQSDLCTFIPNSAGDSGNAFSPSQRLRQRRPLFPRRTASGGGVFYPWKGLAESPRERHKK